MGAIFFYSRDYSQKTICNNFECRQKSFPLIEDKSNVVVMTCDLPKQYGSYDCGLFALAYGIAICMNLYPYSKSHF
jgi:hypothetical protein